MVLDWTDFDARMAEAASLDVSVCYMLWLTPSWASIAGDQVGGSNTVLGPWGVAGESAVPSNMQYLTDITTKVLRRAALTPSVRFILEFWNEPEFYDATALANYISGGGKPFFTGTAAQMVKMCNAVYNAAKAFNPSIPVLMPSQYDITRFNTFLSAQDPTSGKYGYQVFDWVNLHPYTSTPNRFYAGSGDLYNLGGSRIGVAAANRALAALGQSPKPVAVTEWGLDTSASSLYVTNFNALSSAEKKQYIQRTLAMAALDGVKLFVIFSNSTLAGDYVGDTTGVIAAVTDVHQKLAGKTITDGGCDTSTGAVTVVANGTTYSF